MDWIKVRIKTSHEGIEPVSAVLEDFGITGIEIFDKEDFKDFLKNNKKYWDYVDERLEELKNEEGGIALYLSADKEGEETLGKIRTAMSDLKEKDKTAGSLEIITENVKDEDWSENWKKYFKPLAVGEKILIVPEWEEIPETKRKVFLINPGVSFGTGSHESTRMCIKELEKEIKPGMTVSDLGCGSGILSVIALLLGADMVKAADIDPMAVETAYKNLTLNGFDRKMLKAYAGDVTSDKALFEKFSENKADIVVANIVADVIIALLAHVKAFMKKDGKFICSGIIKERTLETEKAVKDAGFKIESVHTEGEWSLIKASL